MYLTAVFKLRVNNHDRRRLDAALDRWRDLHSRSLEQARQRQRELLRCIVAAPALDGTQGRLSVDDRRLNALVLECVPRNMDLHSSARMSLAAVLQKQLASWLVLYLGWIAGGRLGAKPGFPCSRPAPRQAERRRLEALSRLSGSATLDEERRWSDELLRNAHAAALPLFFGAATSGGKRGAAHCGLLRREDGQYFALLTLWGKDDPLGEPVRRARNRTKAGPLRNVRLDVDFEPTDRARASVLLPLELGSGQERLFFRRAQPKTAFLIRREARYQLHVTFEFPDRPPRELTGNLLAVRRGIAHLFSAVVVNTEGAVLHRQCWSGTGLSERISAEERSRAEAQQSGQSLSGDHRVARVKAQHPYAAGHALIDVACRHGARIVLLRDPKARRPKRFLPWRHMSRMRQILTQLAAEAGLPAPLEREIYGSWATCPRCGWRPGDPVRVETPEENGCGGCGAARDAEYHLAQLLALDTLRCTGPRDPLPSLAEFVRDAATRRDSPWMAAT